MRPKIQKFQIGPSAYLVVSNRFAEVGMDLANEFSVIRRFNTMKKNKFMLKYKCPAASRLRGYSIGACICRAIF